MTDYQLTRRRLLQAGAAAGLAGHTPRIAPAQSADIVREVSVADIRHGFSSGAYSIAEFTEASLARIERLDGPDTWLSAMVEVNPDAMEIAEQLDAELKAGQSRGPMHGVPVLIKDVFATADRMQTAAGSLSMVGTPASRDAFVVQRMREAGMVILGKTNMTEWSGYRPVLYGWSSRGDLTVNPYVTTQTTWGSSGGSAAAVAASYAPVALGVETDGSILCPASACGVVAIKPTVGLTSRQGTIGLGYTQDSPGVMGRSVADAAAMLSVIAGRDTQDVAFGEHQQYFPTSLVDADKIPDPGRRDFERAINDEDLTGVRIGVLRTYWGFDLQADAHADQAILALQEAGATVVDDVFSDAANELYSSYTPGNIMGVEFPALFERYLREYAPNGEVQSIADVVQWYEANPETTQFAYDLDAFTWALYPDEEWGDRHLELMNELHSISRDNGIDKLLRDHDLDALVAPTCSLPTRWDNISYFWASSTLAASAGYPSVTVPIGYTESMPAGLHFFGKAFSERQLIRYAAVLERTMQARVAPEFLDYTRYDELYAPVPWE